MTLLPIATGARKHDILWTHVPLTFLSVLPTSHGLNLTSNLILIPKFHLIFFCFIVSKVSQQTRNVDEASAVAEMTSTDSLSHVLFSRVHIAANSTRTTSSPPTYIDDSWEHQQDHFLTSSDDSCIRLDSYHLSEAWMDFTESLALWWDFVTAFIGVLSWKMLGMMYYLTAIGVLK